ncbi:AAA family ATPase [Actinomadura sp. 3N407]|uniref:helix-turn-helix transcriptional regulator n=1 Tax=Actinomadura sp. 3N407 TaxID=3457423 RepID=UPI003FCD2F96
MAQAHPPQRIHGRERELDTIGATLDRARDGHGGSLAIVADAGMGKTTLLEAAVHRAAPGFRTLGTTGVPRETTVPYAGLHRLLRPLSGLIAELPPAHRDALGAITGGDARHGTPFVLYAAVCELLSRAARDRPLLCWADDAQWLDRVSLEALAFAARRVQDEPVAVLFAARGEQRDSDGLAGIRRLRLTPLDDDAGRQVLHDALGDALGCAVPHGTACGDLAEEIVDLACGAPLAIRELAAALTPGQLSGTAPPPRSLPAGSALRYLHRRRYLQLPVGARRLVLMAVADEWLSAATVTRATRTDGIGPRDLDAARASGLLRFEGEAVTVRNRLVRSSLWADASREERQDAHALLVEILVHEWQRPWRLWHRAAMTGEPDDRLAGALAAAARASQKAGRYADSWRIWQRAATLTADHAARTDRLLSAAGDAWASGRSRRARSLLRQVRPFTCAETRAAHAGLLRGEIEVAAGSPATAVPMLRDAAERLAGGDADAALTALMWAAEAADAAGDHRAYLEIADRAATLPRGPRGGVPGDPLGGVPGDHAGAELRGELIRTHLAGVAATIRGRYAEAAERLGRAVLLGAETTDPAAQAWAALSAFTLGDGPSTRTLAAAAVASARRAGNAPIESYALVIAGRSEALLGHPPSPIAACHDGLRLARATRLHAHAAEQLATLALTAAFNGDENTVHGHLERLTGAADRRGLTRAAAFGSWAPACLDLAADRPADAAARLRLPGGAGLAHPPARLMAVPHLVEALVLDGRRAQAVGAFEHYRRWTDGLDGTARAPGRAALARRCLALLADCDTEAGEHFTEALRLHEAAGAVFDLARTELLFGHRLRRDRRPRAAREHLRAALRIFERYDAAPWTARARAELRAAGETITPMPVLEPAPPAGAREIGADGGPGTATATRTANGFGKLTAQQAHIARLAAEGATNREIAARLLLSPRTIDHHLRNVFTRLGIRSRVELARLIR